MGATENAAAETAAKTAQSRTTTKSATSSPSTLTASVGFNAANKPDDVWQVSSSLAANGYLDAPTRTATPQLSSKIFTAQQDMGELKADGLINPGGPTEQRFSKLAGQGFMKEPSTPAPTPTAEPGNSSSGSFGRSPERTPNPSEVKDGTPAKAWARHQQKKQDAARTEAALERRRQEDRAQQKRDLEKNARLMAKAQATEMVATKLSVTPAPSPVTPAKAVGQSSGTLETGQSLSRAQTRGRYDKPRINISDEVFQGNQRTAGHLRTRADVGDLPIFTADAINNNGDAAINEVYNLIDQVRADDPGKANKLLTRTRDGLTADARDRFDQWGIRLIKVVDGNITNQSSPSNDTLKSPDDLMLEPGEKHVTPKEFEHNVTKWHFEDRDELNHPLPISIEDAEKMGFLKYPDWQNAAHQNKRGKPEIKYGHPDGREVIFDGDSRKIIVNPELRGTYNYVTTPPYPPEGREPTAEEKREFIRKSIGHGLLDYVPWWLFDGNDRKK